MNVAIDVPEKLVKIAQRCDFSVIPANQHDTKLRELAQFASKWIPRKNPESIKNIKFRQLDMGKCPPKLVNLINQMDFASVPIMKQNLAMPFIENYLRSNKMLM
jgi:hypothetical protein